MTLEYETPAPEELINHATSASAVSPMRSRWNGAWRRGELPRAMVRCSVIIPVWFLMDLNRL